MTARTLFVCGLGRCGTSLTMQMLHAGGMPCTGRWPAFEPEEISPDRQFGAALNHAWLISQAGHAIKWLDPFRFVPLPDDLPHAFIWLDRDPWEQANSQAKMAYLLAGLPLSNRRQRAAVAARLPGDRAASLKVLGRAPRLDLRFEDLINPAAGAEVRIAEFVASIFLKPLDIQAMTRARRMRGPSCQPSLEIEMSLVEEATA